MPIMPKKKKRPRRWKARPTFPAKFAVGAVVRVKPGTTDPDFADIPLGGWAGMIREVDQRSDPPTYLLEWGERTLDHMHPVYRKRCERDGLELEIMWLSEKDIEPDASEPAVIEQPSSIVTRPLRLDGQDDRIRAVLGLTSDDPLPPANEENLRRYHRYLTTHLSFPFQAKGSVETGPFEQTAYAFTVVGLLDADECDDEDGVLCEAEWKDESAELPLAEIEATINPHNRRLIEDYSYWFGNWPADAFTAPAFAQQMPFGSNPAPPPGKWGLLKALVGYGLYGATYGAVLGSLLAAVEGARTGALVGAAVLGLAGCVAGAKYGMLVEVVNRIRYGSLVGGTLGAVASGVVGALLGAMVVAFAGTLGGGVVGGLVGRLVKRNAVGLFVGAAVGAGLGAVGLAFHQDWEGALTGSLHGAWMGAGAVMLLASVVLGSLVLADHNRANG
jgi:hypothetical protein